MRYLSARIGWLISMDAELGELRFPPDASERKPTIAPKPAVDVATPAAAPMFIDLTQSTDDDASADRSEDESVCETETDSISSMQPVFTPRRRDAATPETSPVPSPLGSPSPEPSGVEASPSSPPRRTSGAGGAVTTALDTQAAVVRLYSGEKRPRKNSRVVRDDRYVRAALTTPKPLAHLGTSVRAILAPPPAVADAAAALTPTGRKKRQFPIRYAMDVPSVSPLSGSGGYDGHAPPELLEDERPIAHATRFLLGQRGLTESTRVDYEKKVSHSWDPFADFIGCDRLFPTPAQVCMWIVYLYSSGTRSHASIVQYVLARKKLQMDYDHAGRQVANPFEHPLVKEIMRTCRSRLKFSPDGDVQDHAVTRAPLPPLDVRAIADKTVAAVDAAYNALSGHDGSAASVVREHLLAIRDGLAVCIGFTFGFRAGHLYDLEFADVEFGRSTSEHPTNIAWGWLPTVAECEADGRVAEYLRVSAHRNKKDAPLDVRRDGGRMLRNSEWMRTLSTMIARWRCVRRWWHAIRIDCAELERTGDIVPLEPAIISAPTAAAWNSIINALTDDLMDCDRIFTMPFETPVSSEAACGAVQAMLQRSLAAAGCPTKPDGPRKYTSHSIRAGGASTAWLVTRSLPIVRWWFRWANASKTPEECYLAFDWNQLHHVYERDAIYFFGWLAAFDFDTPQLAQRLAVPRDF